MIMLDGFASVDTITRVPPGRAPHAGPDVRPVTIAIVNNMPDAALRATERQFCRLLGAASTGMTVKLDFYALPGVMRGAKAKAHIDAYYEDFSSLERHPPDAMIVTGSEPRASNLMDEPFWRALARLVDWSEDNAIPTIWSCLAAHAAVLRMDGIERIGFGRKISGLFECHVTADKPQIMHRMPTHLPVPHSRRYGLDQKSLVAHGYTILSAASETGPDMFLKKAPTLQLFLQGHPEYEPSTLLAEYRRDVVRAACEPNAALPALPAGFADRATRAEISDVASYIATRRQTDMLPRLDSLLASLPAPKDWSGVARTIFCNWLSYVDVERRNAVVPSINIFTGMPERRPAAAVRCGEETVTASCG